jgi:hypothetical protein
MAASEAEDVERLMALLRQWREPGPLLRVRSKHVVPDSTNREQTLLSVEHVHYIAQRFSSEGFHARQPGSVAGHDVPVLVRGGAGCPLGAAALAAWRRRSAEHAGFPRCDVQPGAATFFCSLGNGHFNQALNLYRLNWPSIFTGGRYLVPPGDDALREAIEEGVESLVLRAETPRDARKELSLLLNKAHAAKWYVREDTGDVAVWQPDEGGSGPAPTRGGDPERVSQFEALSKVCDADELGALLRIKLRVDEAAADAGYATALAATPPLPTSKL